MYQMNGAVLEHAHPTGGSGRNSLEARHKPQDHRYILHDRRPYWREEDESEEVNKKYNHYASKKKLSQMRSLEFGRAITTSDLIEYRLSASYLLAQRV